MSSKLILGLIFIFGMSVGFAKASITKNNAELTQAQKILSKYNKKNGLQIKLDMFTEKKVLGTKTIDQGLITYQQGKLNLSIEGDKKSEMVFDGTKAFLISYPDQELDPDGKRKIMFIKSDDNNQLRVLTNLFGDSKKFFSGFNISKSIKSKNELTLILEDKKKVLKPMTLVFLTSEELLSTVSYLDDVGSEVKIKFEKPSFPSSISKNLFKYNPKKNDEVVPQ